MADWLKHIVWLDFAVFGLFTILSWRDGARGASLVFIFFIGLGIFLLLFLGPLEMNDKFIRHTVPLGCWQMDWDEVEKIEVAPKEGGDMVLHGKDKRMAIPGTTLWSGKEKERMIEFFNAEVKKREIKTERTKRAAFQMSKNTKTRL